MSSATERFMTVYEERMRGGGQRAAEVADQIWSESRENLSADERKAVRSLIGDIIVADIKRREIAASEKLFNVLAGCKHSEIVRVPGDDPKAYEAMDDWNGRVNFARWVHKLYSEGFMKDRNYDYGMLTHEHGLDRNHVTRHATLGWVLKNYPELGHRLAQSDVPFDAFFGVFSWGGYKHINDRLNAEWKARDEERAKAV